MNNTRVESSIGNLVTTWQFCNHHLFLYLVTDILNLGRVIGKAMWSAFTIKVVLQL